MNILHLNLSKEATYYIILVVGCIVSLVIYRMIWKRHSRLANWLVFLALGGFICYLIDWNYVFNDYFHIEWSLPGTRESRSYY